MRTSTEALKEIRDRLTYFCLRTDGKYNPPWAAELVGIIDEAVTDSHTFGNMAALREAVIKALTLIHVCDWPPGVSLDGVAEVVREIDSALDKPPRNCDVGTAEEMASRCMAQFYQWRHKSDGKKLITAIMEWAQMPCDAEEGGKGHGKA